MMAFDYYIPTRLHFGAGKLELLGELPLPGRKALIVTTAGKSVRSNGYLDRVVSFVARPPIMACFSNRWFPSVIFFTVAAGKICQREVLDTLHIFNILEAS